MLGKGLAIWLLFLVSYSSAGPRIKRTGLNSLLSVSQPPTPPPAPAPYPIWKVHRYNGVQLQPVESPHKEHPDENEVSLPDYSVDEPEEPDEDNPGSGLGSVLSLIPGGLSGLISLSSGSGRNEDEEDYEAQTADDRFGDAGDPLYTLKKDILTSVLNKKLDLLTALKRDAIQLLVRKALAKKAWIKNLLFGSSYSGYYYNLPYYYPKKSILLNKLSYLPFVGHWFRRSPQLPEVHLPHVPNLVALKDPPNLPAIDLHGNYQLPYQSDTYVKVDIPDKNEQILKPEVEYQVPSTSYGVPESALSVPSLPIYENEPFNSFASYEPVVTTSAPEIAVPEVYPYPPIEPAQPQYNYPQESYPYASSDYYDTAQSEFHPVRDGSSYKDLKETKKKSGGRNIFPNKMIGKSTSKGSINGDHTEKKS